MSPPSKGKGQKEEEARPGKQRVQPGKKSRGHSGGISSRQIDLTKKCDITIFRQWEDGEMYVCWEGLYNGTNSSSSITGSQEKM